METKEKQLKNLVESLNERNRRLQQPCAERIVEELIFGGVKNDEN